MIRSARSRRPRPSRAGAMRVLVALASFGAAASEPIVVGKTFMAGSVDPTSGSTGWALTSHGVSENLFTVNKDGEIVGQVAESVSKVSELIWDVTLKSGYKFSDGTDVTAQAVADCLSELNSANSNAQATIGTMTVTAPSATVVRIESTISTHIMDSVLAEWVFTIYKTDGSDYVFTGPYKIESFVAGDYIDLVPNTHYIDSKHGERHPIKIKRYGSSDLAAAAIAGEVDVGFHLPADATTLADVRAASAVHVRTFEVGYHYMMFHNIGQNSGRAINDVRVREAIDLALDRDAISQALAGGHGTRSLFPDGDGRRARGYSGGAGGFQPRDARMARVPQRLRGGLRALGFRLLRDPPRPLRPRGDAVHAAAGVPVVLVLVVLSRRSGGLAGLRQ